MSKVIVMSKEVFLLGADCETRTRDLLITNGKEGVFYRDIKWLKCLQLRASLR